MHHHLGLVAEAAPAAWLISPMRTCSAHMWTHWYSELATSVDIFGYCAMVGSHSEYAKASVALLPTAEGLVAFRCVACMLHMWTALRNRGHQQVR